MGQTKNIDPKNVINGTFGYMYIDGEEVAELISVSAQDEITYEDVDQPGHLRSGKKMTGVSGTGEFGINKITNSYNEQWAAKIDAGQQPEVTITTVEADPNAQESATWQFYNCTIENIPYINAAAKTLTQDTYTFAFLDRKKLDAIS